jgi:hypothetical protein
MFSAVNGSSSAELRCTSPACAECTEQSKDWSISIMTYNVGIPWHAPCTWGQADGSMALILQELNGFCKQAQVDHAKIHVLLLQDLTATSVDIGWCNTPHVVEHESRRACLGMREADAQRQATVPQRPWC